MSNKINHCILKLKFDRALDRRVKTKDLRGAVANFYPEERLLHQHREDGKLDYCYPLVQYKIIDCECLLIGFKEGAELLANLDLVAKTLSLANESYTILTKEQEFYYISMGITDTSQRYQFITTWLALNEKNYTKYRNLRNWKEKKEFLANILIGNIISMSKGLGYTVSKPIKANILKVKEVSTSLKGTPMLGFLGTFSVNFEIPNLWGLGKSVSRGFGTVVRLE